MLLDFKAKLLPCDSHQIINSLTYFLINLDKTDRLISGKSGAKRAVIFCASLIAFRPCSVEPRTFPQLHMVTQTGNSHDP